MESFLISHTIHQKEKEKNRLRFVGKMAWTASQICQREDEMQIQ